MASVVVIGLATFVFAVFSTTDLYERPPQDWDIIVDECTDSWYYCNFDLRALGDPSETSTQVYEVHGLTMSFVKEIPAGGLTRAPAWMIAPPRDADMEPTAPGEDFVPLESEEPEEPTEPEANPWEGRMLDKSDFPAAVEIEGSEGAVVVYQKAGPANQNLYVVSDGDQWRVISEIPSTDGAVSGFWVAGSGPVVTFRAADGSEHVWGSTDFGYTWHQGGESATY